MRARCQPQVRSAFARYGLLDEQVAFHPGFFRRSLPEERRVLASPIAFLRLDGGGTSDYAALHCGIAMPELHLKPLHDTGSRREDG